MDMAKMEKCVARSGAQQRLKFLQSDPGGQGRRQRVPLGRRRRHVLGKAGGTAAPSSGRSRASRLPAPVPKDQRGGRLWRRRLRHPGPFRGLCFVPKLKEATPQGAGWATKLAGVSAVTRGPGGAFRSAGADSSEGDSSARMWGRLMRVEGKALTEPGVCLLEKREDRKTSPGLPPGPRFQ